MLPDDVDLRKLDDFHIIVYDGVMPKTEIIIGSKTFNGTI